MSDAPAGHVGVPEAQAMLGISRQRVYQLIAMGRLPTRRAGRRIWIPLQALNERIAGEERLASNQCVTTQEVSDFFGVDERTVREWHVSGQLHAQRINNQLCFSPAEIIQFVPPTQTGPGRPPARPGTRRIKGRYFPPPKGTEDEQ